MCQAHLRAAVDLFATLFCTAGAMATTYSYVGPGGAIPDNGNITAPIDVPDDFFIVDVTVQIEGLEHDACGQLTARLVHPGLGLSITLFSAPGGSADSSNFNGTYRFNNNFATSLHQTAENIGDLDDIPSGDYFPSPGDLLAGMGSSGLGTWQLEIDDQEIGTSGSFTQWTLEFQGAGPVLPILYVDDDAGDVGDGSGWNTAYRDLRHALLVAQVAGGTVAEIRIGQGTYRPSLRTQFGEPKSATFQLMNGLVLRGGYAGVGAGDPDDRDPDMFPSALNGDLLDNDAPGSPYNDPSRSDNAAHILTGTGVDGTAEIDGLVITAGVTFGGGGDELPRSGGGLVNAPGSPTVRDCLFTLNWARSGGGAMFNGNGSAPLIIDCRFLSNESDGSGGAIRNDASSPTVTNCVFELNRAANGGAGVMNFDGSHGTFDGCSFVNNDTDGSGGGMRNEAASNPQVTQCTFSGNTADFTGGAMLSQGAAPIVIDCDFDANIASNDGGAVSEAGAAMGTYMDCSFTANIASRDGGAMMLRSSGAAVVGSSFTNNSCNDNGGAIFIDEDVLIDTCSFTGNSAEFGGGIFNERTGTVIVHTQFRDNVADFGGGLYSVDQSDGIVVSTIFAGNHATLVGGGAYDEDQSLTGFTNCLFTGNTAALDGAGIAIGHSSMSTFVNCTLSLNDCGRFCGGAFVLQSSSPSFVNCVLWGNTDASGGTNTEDEQVFTDNASVAVNYCCIEGLTGALGGQANIGTDPMFVDADGVDDIPGTEDDDARLQPGSSSQDTGDPTALPADVLDLDDDGNVDERIPFDLDGFDRVFNFIVDRGAYEVQEDGGGGEGVWIGPAGGSWNDPVNWESGTLPDSDTNVVLPVPVVIDAPGAVAASVTILGGGGLTITTGSLAAGTVVVESGGFLRLEDALATLEVSVLEQQAGGAFEWITGTMSLSGGMWTSIDGVALGCAGLATLDLGDGAVVTAPSLELCANGEIVGNATLTTVFTNAGLVSPGLAGGVGPAVGIVTVDGDYLQEPGGMLAIDMTDYTTAAQADRLDVTGTATLAGMLDVAVADPSMPEVMERAVVHAGTAVVGTFDVVMQTAPAGVFTAGDYATPTEYRVGATVPGPRLYVDIDAVPGGTGQSWAEAASNLETAFAAARLADGAITELWIAEGTYVPATPDDPKDPRTASFHLAAGATLYGGFAGDEMTVEERDPVAHPTELSGDVNGDDGPGFANNGENIYHVVRADGLASTATVDSLTIRGGNGDRGAGALLQSTDVSFRDCMITANEASEGAGVTSEGGGSLTFLRCEVRQNRASNGGGGVLVGDAGTVTMTESLFSSNVAGSVGGAVSCRDGASAVIVDSTFAVNSSADLGGAVGAETGAQLEIRGCTFTANGTSIEGGALYLATAGAEVVRCTFRANVSGIRGGAMYADASSSVFVNCRFLGNRSNSRGGAVTNRFDADAMFVNCLFSGNYAERAGGAVFNFQGHSLLRNCTVAFNDARLEEGGGILNDSDSTADVANSILWGNSELEGEVTETAQIRGSGVIAVDYSCVQGWSGGLGGVGNFGLEPRFRDADGPDNLSGTEDDDLSLFFHSPCLDTGDATLVPPDVADLDGDLDVGEPTPLDLAERMRFSDDPLAADSGSGVPPYLDLGCFELEPVCTGCTGPRVWVEAVGGTFDVDANWFPDAPDVADGAVFDLPDTYVVTFNGAATTDDALVTSGDVTFALGGHTYTVTGAGTEALVVGLLPEKSAALVVSNGSLVVDRARIGAHPASDGTLVVDGAAAALDVQNDAEIGARGTGALVLRADGTAVAGGELRVFAGGALRGDGQVTGNVISQGLVAPGEAAPAALAVTGDYDQQAGGSVEGRLEIDIEGPVSGDEYDVLAVTGQATLAGNLVVSLGGGFEPMLGDTFTILTAGSIVGEFDLAFLPELGSGLVMILSYVESGDSASVVLTVEELTVDFFSFDDAVLVGGFGTPSGAILEDFDGDGDKDAAVIVPAPDNNDPGSVLIFRNAGGNEMGKWLGFEPGFDEVIVDRDPWALATGFFNDDAHPDLVVANRLGPNATVLFNDGNANFTVVQTLPIDPGAGVYGIAAARLYENAHDDIVYGHGSPWRQRFFLNDGSGTFAFEQTLGLGTAGNARLRTADLDLDGDPEVIQITHRRRLLERKRQRSQRGWRLLRDGRSTSLRRRRGRADRRRRRRRRLPGRVRGERRVSDGGDPCEQRRRHAHARAADRGFGRPEPELDPGDRF